MKAASLCLLLLAACDRSEAPPQVLPANAQPAAVTATTARVRPTSAPLPSVLPFPIPQTFAPIPSASSK